jgi:hypothetical protein
VVKVPQVRKIRCKVERSTAGQNIDRIIDLDAL